MLRFNKFSSPSTLPIAILPRTPCCCFASTNSLSHLLKRRRATARREEEAVEEGGGGGGVWERRMEEADEGREKDDFPGARSPE